eukprot:gene20766-10138_t
MVQLRQFIPEEGKTDAVNAVCISDNNNFVLSGGDDMMVSAFDFQDGKGRGNRIKRFGRKRKKAERILMDASIDNRTEYHRSAIRSICMIGTCEDAATGKGYMVITGTVDGMIRIFDFESEDFIFTANPDDRDKNRVPLYRSFAENLKEKEDMYPSDGDTEPDVREIHRIITNWEAGTENPKEGDAKGVSVVLYIAGDLGAASFKLTVKKTAKRTTATTPAGEVGEAEEAKDGDSGTAQMLEVDWREGKEYVDYLNKSSKEKTAKSVYKCFGICLVHSTPTEQSGKGRKEYIAIGGQNGRLIVFDVEKENEPVREAKLRTSIGNGNTEIHAVQAFYDPDNPIESTDFVVVAMANLIRKGRRVIIAEGKDLEEENVVVSVAKNTSGTLGISVQLLNRLHFKHIAGTRMRSILEKTVAKPLYEIMLAPDSDEVKAGLDQADVAYRSTYPTWNALFSFLERHLEDHPAYDKNDLCKGCAWKARFGADIPCTHLDKKKVRACARKGEPYRGWRVSKRRTTDNGNPGVYVFTGGADATVKMLDATTGK